MIGLSDIKEETGEGKLVLSFDVYTDGSMLNYEEEAKVTAKDVLRVYEDPGSVDSIRIALIKGFDIGVFKKWEKEEYEMDVDKK